MRGGGPGADGDMRRAERGEGEGEGEGGAILLLFLLFFLFFLFFIFLLLLFLLLLFFSPKAALCSVPLPSLSQGGVGGRLLRHDQAADGTGPGSEQGAGELTYLFLAAAAVAAAAAVVVVVVATVLLLPSFCESGIK